METILAYLAGVVDSDGSIGIKKSTYAVRRRKDQVNPSYWPRVQISQVSREAVDLCVETFGGSIRLVKPTAEHGKHLFKWDVQHQRAVKVIGALLPYLRIKKQQAGIALELARQKLQPKEGRRTSQHLDRWGKLTAFKHACHSEKQTAGFEALYQQMRQINDTRADRATA